MFAFNIIKVEYGWIEGKIGNDNQEYYFNYSYLTDFLSDLLCSIIATEGIDTGWGKYSSFITEWEPARDRWIIELNDGEYSIYINTVAVDDVEGQLRLDGIRGLVPVDKPSIKPNSFLIKCKREEFLCAIVNECFEILNKYGFCGYWLAFKEEFPLSKLLLINELLKEKTRKENVLSRELEILRDRLL